MLDVQHIGAPALLKSLTELGAIAVGAVSEDHRRCEPPVGQLIEHPERSSPLLDMMDVICQPGLLTAIPVEDRSSFHSCGKNSRQSSGQSLIGCRVHGHGDLTADLPRLPEYWRATPTECLPNFETSVINHPTLRADLRAHPPSQRPRTSAQSHGDWFTNCCHTAHPHPATSSHRLDALALAVQHQPSQIHLTPRALILAAHRRDISPANSTKRPRTRASCLSPKPATPCILNLLDDDHAKKIRAPNTYSFNLTEQSRYLSKYSLLVAPERSRNSPVRRALL